MNPPLIALFRLAVYGPGSRSWSDRADKRGRVKASSGRRGSRSRLRRRGRPRSGSTPARRRPGCVHRRSRCRVVEGQRGRIGAGEVKRRRAGRRLPWTTHLSKAAKAAWTTLCCGPLLTGVVHPRTPSRRADVVGVGVRGARHLPGPDPIGVGLLRRRVAERMRSVWVSNMKTGTLRSVRIRKSSGPWFEVMDDPLSEAPVPPRLWMKMPSNVLVTRLERIGEGRQVVGRLRFAHRHVVLGVEAAEGRSWCVPRAFRSGRTCPGRTGRRDGADCRSGPARPATRPCVGRPQRPRMPYRRRRRAPGRYRHLGVALPHQHRVEIVPVGCRLSGGDIHPFDHHRAVELGGIRRSAHEDPGR